MFNIPNSSFKVAIIDGVSFHCLDTVITYFQRIQFCPEADLETQHAAKWAVNVLATIKNARPDSIEVIAVDS